MSLSAPRFPLKTVIFLLMVLSGCASNKEAGYGIYSGMLPPFSKGSVSPTAWHVIDDVFTKHNTVDDLLGQERFDLHRPVAMAANGSHLYLIDVDRDHLIHYDTVAKKGEVIAYLGRIAQGPVVDIFAYENTFLLLADPRGQQVIKMDMKGNYLGRLKAPGTLRSPVGVAVNRMHNEILVADGDYDHIVAFTFDGEPLATIGERGMDDGQFRSITTLAWGESGLYVAMRPGGRIQQFDQSGQFQNRLNTEGVIFPMAMALDQRERLYVADLMSNNIKVYADGKLVETIGRTGEQPGQFHRITDLWIEKNILYVVDSLNGRIQSRFIY